MNNNNCKICNKREFQIYPNGMCQLCLSKDLERELINNGKEIILDAESLVNDYLTLDKPLNQIANERLLKPSKVRYYLKKYSIKKIRKTAEGYKYIDLNVFTDLNASSAFLLGYIFTDGDLVLSNQTGLYYLRIYSKDRYKIENVKKILKADNKIQHRKERYYKNIRQSEMFFLHIANPIIIEDLLDFGMVDKKNSEIKFPYLTKNLVPHFIRGAWCGSGSVSLDKGCIISSFVNGSIDFITELEKQLHDVGLRKRNIYKNKSSKKSSYFIRYSVSDSEKLYNYMYKGVTDLTTCIKQEKLFKEYFAQNQFQLF